MLDREILQIVNKEAVRKNLEAGSGIRTWKTFWRATKVLVSQGFLFSDNISPHRMGRLMERTVNAYDVHEIALGVGVQKIGRSIVEVLRR